MVLKSVNPTDGTLLATFDELQPERVDHAIQEADTAFQQWRSTTFAERGAVLRRAAELLDKEKAHWARLMTLEMGKPIKQATGEVEKCALACRHFADVGPAYLADEPIATETVSLVRYLPLGVILAIMPWNFPFWQVFRCLAPALMAGNGVLLKHASNVPQCAVGIEDLMRRAGLPPGLFQSLLIGSSRVADVIRDPRIAAVTLTGSEAAGASVASISGAALKKCVLELGGNDPFIVLPSADLAKAIATGVQARVTNNGQSCVCAKRFIVHEKVYDAFEAQFVAAMKALRIGDPLDASTALGPLATTDGRTTLERQVEASRRAGARVLTGGAPLPGPGNFFSATVLTNVTPDAPAYREEIFGPVAVLFKARNLDHAIELANDTPYGLGSSVWTNDPAEQERCVDEIEAGQTFINAMVASDPRLPFGGIKLSGYGRELGSFGAREFTNIKTVVAARSLTQVKAAE